MKTNIKHSFLLPALIVGLNLIPTGRVTAQTFTTIFTTLHSFTAPNWDPSSGVYTNGDGANPVAGLITNSSGNILYGTTRSGGSSGNGTVFAVNTNGTGFTNLYNFTATGIDSSGAYTNGDGANPEAGLILSGNTLYGTAGWGGTSGAGTVFAVNIDGTGFTNLYSFIASSTNSLGVYTNSDGSLPYAGLALSGNTLYGTTIQGGGSGNGTIFAVNTDGSGFTNLHSFTATSVPYPFTNGDGVGPQAGLILSGSTLYGTASQGGGSGYGTVFAVNTDGSGFTNLHSFTTLSGYPGANGDGAYPHGGLILSGSTLYGTANEGGSSGYGTVFAVQTDGTGFTNLHSFFNAPGDGAYPSAGLILSSNTLYGTAYYGGSSGSGTVFALSTDGTGSTTLHNFTRGSDGSHPVAGLVLSGNALYGTAWQGGGSDYGTVFSLSFHWPSTITVTSTADSGPGTLRDALASALSGDTIDATGVSGVILLTSGELLVTNNVTIAGPGPASLAVDGNAANPVFHIAPSHTVTIASLTITNGRRGIYNDHATLMVSNCTVSGNSGGGGIYNGGSGGGSASLQIVNSTVSGNSASSGGAIFNDASSAGSAYLGIDDSTLSGNSAGSGGGIYNIVGSVFVNFCWPHHPPCDRYGYATVYIANSTLSGNSASVGGGIYNGEGLFASGSRTSLFVANSTLSGNSGGGIYNNAYNNSFGGTATLEIFSTILSAGAPGGNIFWPEDFNGWGGAQSDGYNLSSDGGSDILTSPTDQINTDPKLGPLQDNGGPTFTHALLPGSPAIDQGYTASTADQRGFARTVDFNIANAAGGDGTDIGAYELQWPQLTIAPSGPNVLLTWPTNAVGFTLQSTTNLGSPVWTTNSPAPLVIGGQNVVSTPMSGPQQFYRLSQ